VTFFGRSYRNGSGRRIGYLPQKSRHEADFPVLVHEVVLMGLYGQIGWVRQPQQRHKDQAMQALAMVRMADFAKRPFAELSGGEQQRVLIARALAADPELLVLDEPTAAVDITAQHEILEFLENLNREQGLTILMVSHDINEIVHFCDKVLLLNGNTGIFGEPSAVLTKENLRSIYGNRLFVYDHHGHPHIVVGDFHD
jgi:manganese/zinc/iron transport system ATP- binding protein